MTAKPEMDRIPEPGELSIYTLQARLDKMQARLNVLEARQQDAAQRAERQRPLADFGFARDQSEKLPSAQVSLCFNGIPQENWIAAHNVMLELTGLEDPKEAMKQIEERLTAKAEAGAPTSEWMRRYAKVCFTAAAESQTKAVNP